MLWIRFEHSYDKYPVVIEGPFVWVEMIGGDMFGLRPAEGETEVGGEAEEIAGVNDDGTWDAGDLGEDNARRLSDPSVRRRYTRWTMTEES